MTESCSAEAITPVMLSGWWIRSSAGEHCGLCGDWVPQGFLLGLARPSNATARTQISASVRAEWECLACVMFTVRKHEHRDHRDNGGGPR